jgi:hypothetical protein
MLGQGSLGSESRKVLNQTKYCLCSDPRDKVFAVLSLIYPIGKLAKIELDYTKSLYEVYQDVIVQYISAGSLQLLSTIEMHEHLEEVPSWVPDWSTPRLAEPLVPNRVDTKFDAVGGFQQHGILQVTGLPAEVIGSAEAFNLSGDGLDESPTKTILDLQRVVSQIGFRGTHLHFKFAFLELCKTLCANQVSESYSSQFPWLPTLASNEKCLTDLLNLRVDLESTQDFRTTEEEMAVLTRITLYCTGRCLFRSLEGRFGLAPQAARAGDIVTFVLGLTNSIVLRPTNGNKFQVVGEAYCSGITDGGELLGPLPDGIEGVTRYIPAIKGWDFVYLDRNKGTATKVDPRLEDLPLPLGWRLENDAEDGVFSWFVNDEAGEIRYNDPRLTLSF